MTQYTVYLVVPCYGIIARKTIGFSLHYLQIQVLFYEIQC